MPEIHLQLSPKVIFGSYEINRIGNEASQWGQKAMIICEKTLRDKGREIQEHMESSGVDSLLYTDTSDGWASLNVAEAVSLARNGHVEVLVGFGGIKTLNLARAVASLAGTRNRVEDFIDEDMVLKFAIPYIEVPSTGRNPQIFSDVCTIVESRSRKASMVPTPPGTVRTTIIDPTLMLSMSHKSLYLVLLESLFFSIEGYLSGRSSFFSDSPALTAVENYIQALEALAENPEAPFVRDTFCQASIFSGFCQSLTGLTPGNILSYSIAAFFKVPKASVATILFPYFFESALYPFTEKVKKVLGLFKEPGSDIASTIRKFIGYLELPSRLHDLGIPMDDLSTVADIAGDIASDKIIGVDKSEFFTILKSAF